MELDPQASPQNVIDQITQGIAQEALNAMDTAYPIQRQPSLNDPTPAPATQPQAGQAGTAPAGQPGPQGQPSAGQKRYAGKYLSVEELEQGAVHGQSLITRLQQENAQLRTVAQSQPAPVQPTAPRANPTELAVARSERLKQFEQQHNIPAQDIAAVVADIAREVVDQTLAPDRAQSQAMNYMRSNHPRFFDFQSEVLAHVQANPALQGVISRELARGNFEGAMEMGWSNYALAAGVNVHQKMAANNAVLQEQVEQARNDAGLVSTQASGVHQANPDERGISTERFQELVELSRQGYNMPLAREVFGYGLPDELFGIQR